MIDVYAIRSVLEGTEVSLKDALREQCTKRTDTTYRESNIEHLIKALEHVQSAITELIKVIL